MHLPDAAVLPRFASFAPVARMGGLGAVFVCVLVVAPVCSRRTRFMLAIAAHCRPSQLQRQKGQKKEHEDFSHGRDCSTRAARAPV